MPFAAEEIEALSPCARVEVQEYYARKFLASVAPWIPVERRRAMRLKFKPPAWPHAWPSRHEDPMQAHLAKIDRQEWAALHLRKGTKDANGG